MAYIVFGHGYEKRGRDVVPDGCTLVLTEECGLLGTIPFYVLEAMAKPAALFMDPVKNKAAIESLLRRRIRVYQAGQEAPRLYVSLVSEHSNKPGVYQPSGVHSLPLDLADITYNPDADGDKRYETRKIDLSFRGSKIPQTDQTLSQLKLFEHLPGIHYNFLCRSKMPSSASSDTSFDLDYLEDAVKALFPDAIDLLKAYDPVRTIDIWIQSQKGPFTEEQQRIADQIHREAVRQSSARRKSGSPLGNRATDILVDLLAATAPPPKPVAELMAALEDVDRGIRHYGVTPLMAAARFGHRWVMEALLKAGAGLEVRDEEGATALHYACSSRNPEAALLLIAAGAKVSIADIEGDTPLIMAASKPELTPVVEALVARGANPNMKSHSGYTALHIAAGWPGTDRMIGVLLAAGADVNADNKKGETPVFQAIVDGNAASLTQLLATGAVKLDKRTEKGESYVGAAIRTSHGAIAIQLLKAGVPVKSKEVLRKAVVDKGGMDDVLAFIDKN
jgi:ankyrin repeat protein